MFTRSERLFLRPGWPEDWEEMLAAIADEAVVRNLARAPWPYTGEHAREFVRREQDRRHPHFLVTLPGAAGARLIGCVGLNPDRGTAELGYWIARDHWGKGYATEAARALLGLARTLGHRHIRAGHFADNPASGRVLCKLGFRDTGRCEPRYSPGRGTSALSRLYERDLGGPSNCDSGDDCDKAPRAA